MNPFSPKFTDPHQPLPTPPPWRKRKGSDPTGTDLLAPVPEDPAAEADLKDRASRHEFSESLWEVRVIEAALLLRRPILLSGRPGVGKSSLAYVAAHYLGLGPVLRWDVNSKSTVKDAIYQYDAIRRMQEGDHSDEGQYFTLGPLGTALLPRTRPRVLLIDEIDKSDLDLPDDLLNVLEEGQVRIPELERLNQPGVPISVPTWEPGSRANIINGVIQAYEFPLIFLTSNGERDFSGAFLRRCLTLEMKQPTKEDLIKIVKKQLGAWTDERGNPAKINETLLATMAAEFEKRMKSEVVTTDQLLSTFFVRAQHDFQPQIEKHTASDTSVSPQVN